MEIGAGDIVECIQAPTSAFAVGSVYRVIEVGPEVWCTCMTNGFRPWAFAHRGLRFGDAPDPHPESAGQGRRAIAWCSYDFKPISRRADFETFLAEIKTPVPVPEHETA